MAHLVDMNTSKRNMIMSKKKTYSILLISCFVLLASIGILYYITNPSHRIIPSLSDSSYFIAHATGSLEGYTYLNSKESLLSSLDNGYKYIEFDLQYTSDSIIVCVHNWEQFNKATIPNICGQDSDKYMKVPSYAEFKNRKIYGKYTPLSLQDVISIQSQIPFTIVTDIISDAKALNHYFPKNLRRDVMVEAFSEIDYKELKADGYIPMLSLGCISIIPDGLSFICSNIISNEYEWIAAEQHSSKRTLRLLRKLFGIKIALHTVNSAAFYSWHLANDVDLIYTDNWNLRRQLNNYEDNSTR